MILIIVEDLASLFLSGSNTVRTPIDWPCPIVWIEFHLEFEQIPGSCARRLLHRIDSHTRVASRQRQILSVSITDAKKLQVKPYCVERWPMERNGKPQKDKLHGDRIRRMTKYYVHKVARQAIRLLVPKKPVPGSRGARSSMP